jgi:hypothetical protein
MNRIKVIIANYLLKYLYNAITEDEILKHNGKEFYVAGKKLPEGDCRDIITGADAIQKMYTWKLIIKDIKFHANQDIFEKSQTIDDVIFGKSVLYVVDVIEKKLDKLSKL